MTKEIRRVMAALIGVAWIIIGGSFILLFIETPRKWVKKILWSLKWKFKSLRYKISKI